MAEGDLSPRTKQIGVAAAALALGAIGAAWLGSGDPKPPPPARSAASATPPLAVSEAAPSAAKPIGLPAPERLVAIGDLHGDLDAARAVLRLAGAIDEGGKWTGGKLVVVQTGDQLDRGDGERGIVDLFDRLADDARAAGGAVISLNGNHEVMNVSLDFRYVTEGGYKDFAGVPGADTADPRLAALPPEARSRAAALLPGGPYARRLAKRDTIAIIGDTVFAHGGVLPKHVAYGIDRINRDVSAFMNGDSKAPPAIVTSEDGPIWTRLYSAAPDARDCRTLGEALAALGKKRMVVGHTVQRNGINPACDERVWRIDVGLSRHYGGKPEVLEIRGDAVKPLRAP